jgi:hypothetical protein
MHSDIYRNTNVPNFVQSGRLNRIEVVDNCGLRQTLRASGSGLKTKPPKILASDKK